MTGISEEISAKEANDILWNAFTKSLSPWEPDKGLYEHAEKKFGARVQEIVGQAQARKLIEFAAETCCTESGKVCQQLTPQGQKVTPKTYDEAAKLVRENVPAENGGILCN